MSNFDRKYYGFLKGYVQDIPRSSKTNLKRLNAKI